MSTVTKALAVLGTAGSAMFFAVSPAWATFYGNTVDYGHISSSSSCSVAATPGYCKILYTDNSAVSRPPKTGGVKYCGAHGIPDGTTIAEAIASGRLNGVYVAVLWGGTGAVGALNCHG
jgi:hypothetical protein